MSDLVFIMQTVVIRLHVTVPIQHRDQPLRGVMIELSRLNIESAVENFFSELNQIDW